ncbi:MAG: GNAT family N-acetyltransferase [Pseudoxanthomonas sp.]
MLIVPDQRHHLPGVVAIFLLIEREEFDLAIVPEAQPDLDDIAGFSRPGAGNIRVALDGASEVVGTLARLDIGHGQAALRRKRCVRRAWRGGAQGVAETLLRTLLAWARARHLWEIFLGTTAAFLATHRFHETHDLAQVAHDALPQAFPVMAVDSRIYLRDLVHVASRMPA